MGDPPRASIVNFLLVVTLLSALFLFFFQLSVCACIHFSFPPAHKSKGKDGKKEIARQRKDPIFNTFLFLLPGLLHLLLLLLLLPFLLPGSLAATLLPCDMQQRPPSAPFRRLSSFSCRLSAARARCTKPPPHLVTSRLLVALGRRRAQAKLILQLAARRLAVPRQRQQRHASPVRHLFTSRGKASGAGGRAGGRGSRRRRAGEWRTRRAGAPQCSMPRPGTRRTRRGS